MSMAEAISQPVGAFWKVVIGVLTASILGLGGWINAQSVQTAEIRGSLDTLRQITTQHQAEIADLERSRRQSETQAAGLEARFDGLERSMEANFARLENHITSLLRRNPQ